MSTIDKVKVGDTTYDVSPSATGTLNGYTSNDNGTPPAEWGEVSTISAGDTNSSIFGKLTSMVRNVRWLYSKLGTEDFSVTGQSTVSGALSGLNSELGNKSNTSHTHNTDTLPVSNNQVNSTSYIPTSALLYSMKDRADGIQSIIAAAKRELDDPNKRYEDKNLGTLSSLSQVDTFLSTYTHENNYEGLSLGNYITIQESTYVSNIWVIAGFDMEHGQMAADGTIYDNGYGICMISKSGIDSHQIEWNGEGKGVIGGYKSSYIHNDVLNSQASYDLLARLKNILGSHLIDRNVLLSNSVDTANGYASNGYEWTTAHLTLMSVGQLTGVFASHTTKYDDGEANYKLPLFNHVGYGYNHWLRNISTNGDHVSMFDTYIVNNSSNISTDYYRDKNYYRPMIYIR